MHEFLTLSLTATAADRLNIFSVLPLVRELFLLVNHLTNQFSGQVLFCSVWKQWIRGHLFPAGPSSSTFTLPVDNTCDSFLKVLVGATDSCWTLPPSPPHPPPFPAPPWVFWTYCLCSVDKRWKFDGTFQASAALPPPVLYRKRQIKLISLSNCVWWKGPPHKSDHKSNKKMYWREAFHL